LKIVELTVKLQLRCVDLLLEWMWGDLKWWQYLFLPFATSYSIGFFVAFRNSGIYK